MKLSQSQLRTKGVLWSSISTALTLACIRTYGQSVAAKLEEEAFRRQHEARIRLGGCTEKIDTPQTCALLQQAIDADFGLHPELKDVDGRSWLIYGPPYCTGDGPFAPSMAPAALSPEIGSARFRGLHASTARLGTAGIVFFHTHSVTDGDIVDAGYFAHTQSANSTGGIVSYAREHSTLPNGALEALTERIADAPENVTEVSASAVKAAAWRMIVLGELLGPIAAAAVIEHAFRIVLTSRWKWLPDALNLPVADSPTTAASFYEAVGLLVGDSSTRDDGYRDRAILKPNSDNIWSDHPNTPIAFKVAIIRAWSASLTHHSFHLRARAVPDESGRCIAAVVFDNKGPE